MRKRLVLTVLCIGLCVSLPASGAAAQDPCGDSLSARMLELFKDPDERVSLGAMLISDLILHDECLVAHVLNSRHAKESPRERAVKNFYLALVRPYEGRGGGHIFRFINDFPEDPAAFVATLSFDASLTRTVSGRMIMELVSLGDCANPVDTVREAARTKIARLRDIQDRSGWAAEIFSEDFEECGNAEGGR